MHATLAKANDKAAGPLRARNAVWVQVWLSLVLAFHLIAPSICPHEALHSAPQATAHQAMASELASLSRAVGHAVVLCHHAGGDSDHHGDGHHNDCCGCDLCQAMRGAEVLPVSASPITPSQTVHAVAVRFAWLFIARPAPFVGATSPRGPPRLV